MWVRLLLAVLLATGTTPFRGCDCAAGEADPATSEHDHDGGHPHPADHDADCPLLQPDAELSATAVPSAADDLAVESPPVPVTLARRPSDRSDPCLASQPGPAPVPLYISLRALRN